MFPCIGNILNLIFRKGDTMIIYILKRILGLIPVMIGVTFMIFFIMNLTPGDPARMILGEEAEKDSLEELREEMGLNEPLIMQYGKYMLNLIKGDMGISYKTETSVAGEISTRFPYTLRLAIFAIFISLIISVPLGVISAMKQNTPIDGFSMLFALAGISMPSFWLGLLFILIFSVSLGWLPSGGASDFKSYIMPALTLGTATMASITRTTRSSFLEVIRQDYIRTAKAKGLKKRIIIIKHALRNALIPTITVAGLEVGIMLGGAVVTETIFSWPGIGRLMVNSIKAKDTPMVLGCIIIFSLCFSIVNLLVDILYAYIDPRIKSQYQ